MKDLINKEFYKQQLNRFSERKDILTTRLNYISVLRLIAIVLAIWLLVISIRDSNLVTGLFSLASVTGFFILVSLHKNTQDERNKILALIKINEDELEALNGNFSMFGQGTEHLDTEHEFTYDLDIFGERSVFQFINRCCTKAGAQLLAKEMIFSPGTDSEIISSQEVLKELTNTQEKLQQYRASGMLTEDSLEEQQEINNWLGKVLFKLSFFSTFFIYLASATNISMLILTILNPANFMFLVLSSLATWLFYSFYFARINRYHTLISRKQSLINKYLGMSKVLAGIDFKNEALVSYRKKAAGSIKMLKELDILMNFFDSRLNLLVGFILNTLFLLDFQIILALNKWKKKYKSELEHLFVLHAEFDALVSKSVYVFNNPDFVFPEISTDAVNAKNLGHPLLHSSKRVCNDFSITGDEKVIIITGANMAGKSTFLRSVGVNLILAGLGLPVCADKFSFHPEKIISGMRTTDSLAESESYFFAELKRLQRIIQGLNQGESYFILLDEILKGTNSTDKHLGSEALIKQLTLKNARTIIATHDLKLGNLENSFPGLVKNFHFESQIENEELVFDYKLREGIAVNMNASFLMKKMGIIP